MLLVGDSWATATWASTPPSRSPWKPHDDAVRGRRARHPPRADRGRPTFGSVPGGPGAGAAQRTRLVKEAGVGAVKLEGGERRSPRRELIVQSGIPVMWLLGLTPQSVKPMGYRVQGRGDAA